MMKKYTLILLFLLSLSAARGQDSSSVKFGLGFTLVDFRDMANTFFSYHYFSPNFSIPIVIKNMVRIEPSIGYFNRNIEFKSQENENDFYKVSDSNTHLGLGLFFLKQYAPLQVYWGSYFSYIISTEKQNDKDDRDTEEGDGYSIGPAFGMEYLFNKHFSLGGEIRAQYLKLVREEDSTRETADKDKITYHSFVTRALITLRFYF
ncbi:outer membrane beta-barrel protein [Caldithrix abyssi]